MKTDFKLLLLCLAAAAFTLALAVPDSSPAAAHRLRFVSAGLLLWAVEVILVLAAVL